MKRENLSEDVTRVILEAADGSSFAPLVFRKEGRVFLTQTGCVFSPRPVWRLSGDPGMAETRQTANGEVVSFQPDHCRRVGETHSVQLSFAVSGSPVLTGLGAHEDGIFDYSDQSEYLYHHNMKIPIPFLLSSDGWGILFEAGCAMKFFGQGSSFRMDLDAADTVSYLVIRGQNCAEVLRRLSGFTGKPALLPKWAYGYIQSRERYHSAAELLAAAQEFRRRKLGLDCIVLDWLSWKEGCWGDKTADPDRFPDVPGMIGALHALHVRFMVSVWPNMDHGRDCEEMKNAGGFLPASRIYNAFSPEARDLYWQQCRRCWMDAGADALWCDSCEPFTDPDWCGPEKRDPEERCRLVTEAASLRIDPEKISLYASAHLRGLRDHWLRDIPHKRPVLLARSGGPDAGSLGAILWSGDISARWDVLAAQVTEAVRVSCSGIPWWTVDIGGFFTSRREPWFWRGDYPSGVNDPAYRELYVRWFQFGSMLPVFRSHGTDTPREPWAFGDGAEFGCLEQVLRLRYRLLPYLYASAARSCREGLPMLQAMMVAFPDDPSVLRLQDQYMLGDALLVRPVTRSLQDGGGVTEVTLPAGTGWYDLLSGGFTEGGRHLQAATPLDRFPVFVRAGSILPVAENAESTADLPFPARELWIYGGADGSFSLYDDAGDGMDYLDGAFLQIPVHYSDADRTLTLGRAEGTLPADCDFRIRFLFPDGTEEIRSLRYCGRECRVQATASRTLRTAFATSSNCSGVRI